MSASWHRWYRRARAKLLDAFGNACELCGSHRRLQFAHRFPFAPDGPSRGSARRLATVRANPFLFALLCRECHRALDGREPYERRQARYPEIWRTPASVAIAGAA